MHFFKKCIALGLSLVIIGSSSASVAHAAYTQDDNFFNSNNILFYCKPSEDNTCANNQCSSNGSDGSTDVTTLTGSSNLQKIGDYFIAKGFTKVQAAGIIGNMQAESGLSATRQEDPVSSFPSNGWGLAQWTNTLGSPRRTNVVDAVKAADSSLMDYYSAQYGGGTDASTGYVAAGIPADKNNAILLAELNFAYKEVSQASVRPDAILAGYGSPGQKLLAALKDQTTVKAATLLWLYGNEHPTNLTGQAAIQAMAGTAATRTGYAEDALKALGGSDSSAASGSSATNPCGVTAGDGTTVAAGPTRTKIVEIAQAEYKKWASGTYKVGSNDYQKYTWGASAEWCAFFASWVYSQAGVPLQGRAGDSSSAQGSTTAVMNIGKAGGNFTWHEAGSYTPQPGDIAVYINGSLFHVNIVIKATGPRTYEDIGGNEGSHISDFQYNTVKDDDGIGSNGIRDTYWTSQVIGFVSPKNN